MGIISKVIDVAIKTFTQLTVERFPKCNIKAYNYTTSGDDSPPIEKDRVILVKVDGTGEYVVAGVLTKSQGAKNGEKILFSRDGDGNVQAIIKLLNDGTISFTAPGGVNVTTDKDYKLEASGDVGIKGTNVKMDGKVKVTGGTFECAGTVIPDGTGCLCGMPFCPITGAPITGKTASGT